MGGRGQSHVYMSITYMYTILLCTCTCIHLLTQAWIEGLHFSDFIVIVLLFVMCIIIDYFITRGAGHEFITSTDTSLSAYAEETLIIRDQQEVGCIIRD